MTQADLNKRQNCKNASNMRRNIDVEALERQKAEKSKLKQIENELNLRYEQQTDVIQKVVHNKELGLEKRKRLVESDINYYRSRFQRPEQRREFDLNDPERKRSRQPVRIADDDFSLGISSAQVFNGEDMGCRERKTKATSTTKSLVGSTDCRKKKANDSLLQADKALQESIACREKRLEDTAEYRT
ncbi:RIB43A-like with coiled-coils protein 2 [Eumeta japonica]|uniref:RIB43A-like with coiled-coils protein 2 n=1 Tax=Eumeta variegata TaxID=151549 RepID=A0A4C1SEB3_EUMVA|nr:RIB43A-like with coiled-coils protein 2 [Eumeta japonica]